MRCDGLTCRCWFPCACSAVGRRSGSTGGFPAQTEMGTLCRRGGSGRSAAPGGFGCAPGTDPTCGTSGSKTSARIYKPAGKGTEIPELVLRSRVSRNEGNKQTKPGKLTLKFPPIKFQYVCTVISTVSFWFLKIIFQVYCFD